MRTVSSSVAPLLVLVVAATAALLSVGAGAGASVPIVVTRSVGDARVLSAVKLRRTFSFVNGALDSTLNMTIVDGVLTTMMTQMLLDGSLLHSEPVSEPFLAFDQDSNAWKARPHSVITIDFVKANSLVKFGLNRQIARRFVSQSEARVRRSGSPEMDPECVDPQVSGKVCCFLGANLYDVYTLVDSPNVMSVTCAVPNPAAGSVDGITPLHMEFSAAINASATTGIPGAPPKSSAVVTAMVYRRDSNKTVLEVLHGPQLPGAALRVGATVNLSLLVMGIVMERAPIFASNPGIAMRICREGFDIGSPIFAEPFFVPAWGFGFESRKIGYNRSQYVRDRASCLGEPLGDFTSRDGNNEDQFSFARTHDVHNYWGTCSWVNRVTSNVDAQLNRILEAMFLRCHNIGRVSGEVWVDFATPEAAFAFAPLFAMPSIEAVAAAPLSTAGSWRSGEGEGVLLLVDVFNHGEVPTGSGLRVACEQCCLAAASENDVTTMAECLESPHSIGGWPLAVPDPDATDDGALLQQSHGAFTAGSAGFAIEPTAIRRFAFRADVAEWLQMSDTELGSAPLAFVGLCRFSVAEAGINSSGFASDDGSTRIWRSRTCSFRIVHAPGSADGTSAVVAGLLCPEDHQPFWAKPGDRSAHVRNPTSECVPFNDPGCDAAYGDARRTWSAELQRCAKSDEGDSGPAEAPQGSASMAWRSRSTSESPGTSRSRATSAELESGRTTRHSVSESLSNLPPPTPPPISTPIPSAPAPSSLTHTSEGEAARSGVFIATAVFMALLGAAAAGVVAQVALRTRAENLRFCAFLGRVAQLLFSRCHSSSASRTPPSNVSATRARKGAEPASSPSIRRTAGRVGSSAARGTDANSPHCVKLPAPLPPPPMALPAVPDPRDDPFRMMRAVVRAQQPQQQHWRGQLQDEEGEEKGVGDVAPLPVLRLMPPPPTPTPQQQSSRLIGDVHRSPGRSKKSRQSSCTSRVDVSESSHIVAVPRSPRMSPARVQALARPPPECEDTQLPPDVEPHDDALQYAG